MDILMVHPHDIYSKSEPWTVRIIYIAKEFAKKGHSVKLVYFPLTWEKQAPHILHENITIIPLCRMHSASIFVSNISKLCSLAGGSDIIHLQKCFYHASLPAVIAGLIKHKPVHYDWDDWELKIYEASTRPGILRSLVWVFLYFLESIIPKIVDTISCASERLKKECKKLGVDKTRIFNAAVGADILRFSPAVSGKPVRQKYEINKPLVLYLGQLHGGQYVEIFIKAAALLVSEYKKDISFMIVGDGYRADELKKLSGSLGLGSRLIFTGAVSHKHVPDYIAAADVCVGCFEDNDVTACKSPLKIAEYMACGKAIVASSVGDVPKMLGNAGILYPPLDIPALARAVIRILDDDKLKRELEVLSRERAQAVYNWSVTAENILRAYQKACQIDEKGFSKGHPTCV
jgi:glycosyltransferase involved in cell wall biosynthesis